jgi:DNA repair protein RadC
MDNESTSIKIHDLDSGDRPREKAMKLGVKALSDTELMAIIFGGGLPGKSVIQLSQEILKDQDNRLARIARMSIHELSTKYKGIGPAKAVSLASAIELGIRCMADFKRTDERITSSQDVFDLMSPHMCRLNYEEFWVIHLTNANRIIAKECLSSGGTASTLVDVKLLMKRAVDKLSSGIILVHNHPSGSIRASQADTTLTQRVKQACQILDIRLLDHVIITADSFYSFNDNSAL